MPSVTHCKGCGKQIIFVTMPNGSTMPVDLSLHVIAVDMDAGNNFVGSNANTNPNLGIAYGLNHFLTCPKADNFSKKAQPDRTPQGQPVTDSKMEAAGG